MMRTPRAIHPRRSERSALGPLTTAVVVGLDLGREHDFSAWSVIQVVEEPTGRRVTMPEPPILSAFRHGGRPGPPRVCAETATTLRLRLLERDRRVPYPEVVARTARLLDQVAAFIAAEAPPVDPSSWRQASVPGLELVVDATGVGAPVTDLLRRANLAAVVRPVVITGGDTATVDGQRVFRVPKGHLVSALAVALESGVLRWPKSLELREEFERELQGLRARTTPRGHTAVDAGPGEYGAEAHDDLAMSVALATWWALHAAGAVVV